MLGYNYVNVEYKVVSDNDHWEPIGPGKVGAEGVGGITQAGCFSDIQNQLIVWNAPFECSYRSTSLIGWPQLVLTVKAPDIFGRTVVIAYGNVHLPVQPG